LVRESLPRAVQLLNKTNQFNLTLRRLSEENFWDWAQQPGNASYTFHVSDRFGDFGLTGLASLSISGTEARIVDFVMSCRVMGKRVEEALLGYILAQARAGGADRIIAPLVDGPRNGPAKTFFASKFVTGESSLIDTEGVAIPPQISLERNRESLLALQY
jgi:FkbH-like protein